MKRIYSATLASLVALAAICAPAQAALPALRAPQIVFNNTALQSRLTGFGESINVTTEQRDALVWGSTVSTNSTMTIQFELADNTNGNEVGIAALNTAGNAVISNNPVFPIGGLAPGWFAVASFRAGDILKVNLFDPTATLVGPTMTYPAVRRSLFAYYIKNANGAYYSHEGLNADGKVRPLPFAGTGENTGCWWLSWEDSLNPDSTADYDDGLVFMESLNPTPVNHTTWGSVKARFR